MRKAFYKLYKLTTLVGGLAFALAVVFLILKVTAWLVVKLEPGPNFFLGKDVLVATCLDWLFLKAMDFFLVTACVYIPLNFTFGDVYEKPTSTK